MKPKNPETIIVKNKFYPKGLREIDVYNYYEKNKSIIMKEVRNRDIMFAIMVELNKPILKRKINGKFIKLTNATYDKYNTGRAITFYSTMGFYEEVAVVDIDTDDFVKAKEATKDVFDELNGADFISHLKIRYTGKNSFHIFCNLSQKFKIDNARMLLESHLFGKKNIAGRYTIRSKRTRGIPNIDLWASNKKNGAFITLNSLSLWGLRCMEVPHRNMNSFKMKDAEVR